MKKELDARDLGEKSAKLVKAEDKRDFPEVSKVYRVIDEDTVTAVVDEDLAKRLARHDKVDPLDLVRCSVRIRRADVRRYSMRPIIEDEVYKWTLAYDPELLGYMAGVFDAERAASGDFLGG
jgi:hypothetical protein